MIATMVFVTIIQASSVLLLLLNFNVFKKQSEKYRELMAKLGNEVAWGNPGRILLPIYCILTLAAAIAIILLFLFQPHIL